MIEFSGSSANDRLIRDRMELIRLLTYEADLSTE